MKTMITRHNYKKFKYLTQGNNLLYAHLLSHSECTFDSKLLIFTKMFTKD